MSSLPVKQVGFQSSTWKNGIGMVQNWTLSTCARKPYKWAGEHHRKSSCSYHSNSSRTQNFPQKTASTNHLESPLNFSSDFRAFITFIVRELEFLVSSGWRCCISTWSACFQRFSLDWQIVINPTTHGFLQDIFQRALCRTLRTRGLIKLSCSTQ